MGGTSQDVAIAQQTKVLPGIFLSSSSSAEVFAFVDLCFSEEVFAALMAE
jgi:hypothetical protein